MGGGGSYDTAMRAAFLWWSHRAEGGGGRVHRGGGRKVGNSLLTLGDRESLHMALRPLRLAVPGASFADVSPHPGPLFTERACPPLQLFLPLGCCTAAAVGCNLYVGVGAVSRPMPQTENAAYSPKWQWAGPCAVSFHSGQYWNSESAPFAV